VPAFGVCGQKLGDNDARISWFLPWGSRSLLNWQHKREMNRPKEIEKRQKPEKGEN